MMEERADLAAKWAERYDLLEEPTFASTDGALDAVVCATIAYLYHHDGVALQRLPSDDRERRGRGPFYVTTPKPKKAQK